MCARGHRVSFVVPGGTIDRELARQINPAIQVIESAARLTAPRSPLALLKLTGSLARATPPADILIATHTPALTARLAHNGLHTARRYTWKAMTDRMEEALAQVTPEIHDVNHRAEKM